MRILGVDPGEKNIGIAISDPTGIVASPLTTLKHVSRLIDAASVAELARQHKVACIVIGSSMDEDGNPTPQSRSAERFAAAIKQQCDLPILLWDESFSTQEARQARILMGTSRKKRAGHLDELAATVILQDYLNSISGL